MTVTNSTEKDQWYQHFYDVFTTFFDNDSNGIDDDEVDDERGYGDSENDDIAALECDITEGEVYEAIRMLKNGKAAGPGLTIGEKKRKKILLHMLSPF